MSLQSRLQDSEQNFKVSWGDEQTGCVLKTSQELTDWWGDWCSLDPPPFLLPGIWALIEAAVRSPFT